MHQDPNTVSQNQALFTGELFLCFTSFFLSPQFTGEKTREIQFDENSVYYFSIFLGHCEIIKKYVAYVAASHFSVNFNILSTRYCFSPQPIIGGIKKMICIRTFSRVSQRVKSSFSAIFCKVPNGMTCKKGN